MSAVAYVVERAAGFGLASADAPPPDFEGMTDDEIAEVNFDDYENPTSYVPVKAFAEPAAAAAERDRLEAEVRAALPPVALMEYENWERTGGSKAVAAGLAALGLDPPTFGASEYSHGKEFKAWWAARAGDLTPGQRAKIWDLFAGLRVYRVVERPLEE